MKLENDITEDTTYGFKGRVAQYHSRTIELQGGAKRYTLSLSADSLITNKVLEEVK